jgi:hypothetical protein
MQGVFVDKESRLLVTFLVVVPFYTCATRTPLTCGYAGDDPNDCPRDLPRGEAVARNCNSATSPDAYGHYR